MGTDRSSALYIAVVYIYPITGEQIHIDMAKRFIRNYNDFTAGVPHRLFVICNGSEPSREDIDRWAGIDFQFFQHDDTGWDIGAFQHAAHDIPCDLMVCCGGHTYWVRPNWLKRIAEAFNEHGPGLYGASGSFERSPHIRTTTFWCHPGLLRDYPKKVITKAERYSFEASPESVTWLAKSQRLPCLVVTWDKVYDLSEARRIPNTFRRGDQSNTLASDRYFDVWAAADEKESRKLARLADTPVPRWRSRLNHLIRQFIGR